MARQTRIERFGSIRNPGAVDTSQKLQALSNLGKQVGEVAFNVGAKQQAKKGAEAGFESAQSGQEPEERGGILPSIFDESFNKAQQAAYIASADRNAVERLSQLEQENEYDSESYSNKASAMLEGVIESVPEPYKPVLHQSISDYISRGKMRINNNIFKLGKEEARIELLGALDTYSREATRAARNGDKEEADDLIAKAKLSAEALVQSKEWTKEEADEAIRRAKNEITEQSYLQIVDDMPLDQAVAAIDKAEKNVPKGFSGDEWDTLIARARARLQSRLVERKKSNAIDKSAFRNRQAAVEIAIKTGEGDSEDILLELTDLFNKQVYSPTQYAGLVGTVYNDLRKREKVWERVENNDTSILVDPNAVDKVYRKDISDLDDAQKVQFASSVNMVPKQMEDEIKNSLYSGDIDQAGKAADMIARLDDIQGLPDYFSGQDRAYAQQLTDLMSIHPPEEAIRIARKNTDPRDKERIQSRRDQLKEDYDQDDWLDGAESALGPFFGSLDKMIAPQIAKDYQTVFEANFIAGMDKSRAKKAAEKQLKQVYSKWNGRQMKHAPNKYYSVDGDSDWIKKDLKKELSANIAGAPEIQDFYLIADDRTEREAQAGQPTYLVRYKTDDGWNMLMGRYIPDIESQQKSVALDAEALIKEKRADTKRREQSLKDANQFIKDTVLLQ